MGSIPYPWKYTITTILYSSGECESGNEKFVPKITVWHHEACLVMTNGDPWVHRSVGNSASLVSHWNGWPSGWDFLSPLNTNDGFDLSRMGKNNGNPDLVCENNTHVYALYFILFYLLGL